MPSSKHPGRRKQLAAWLNMAGVLPLAGRFRDLFRQDLRILAYHRVLDSSEPSDFDFDMELISASAEDFRWQMEVIRRDFHPMRFDEVVDCLDRGKRLPPRAILVTFDDGYDDNYRIAFPILRDLGMSAMFFVSTGHIESGIPYAYDWLVYMVSTTIATRIDAPGIGVAWELPASLAGRRECAVKILNIMKRHDALVQEEVIESLERSWSMPRLPHADCKPMTWAQLREMCDGGMEVGSHGVHHRMLAKLPTELMQEEVAASKAALEMNLGREISAISYPIGGFEAFDDAVEDATKAAGFRLACSYIAGINCVGKSSPFSLRRLHVERDVDAAWFHGMLEFPEIFSYRTNMLIG